MRLRQKLLQYLNLFIILVTVKSYTVDYCQDVGQPEGQNKTEEYNITSDNDGQLYISMDLDDSPEEEVEYVGKIVKIAVLGLKGSGVSSTIRQLIGPNSECSTPDNRNNNATATLHHFLEYTVDVPSSSTNESFYQLQLLDIPGFGGDLKEEAEFLAALKYHIQVSGQPDFFLGLAKFNDNVIGKMKSSPFVQFLKRFELFHNVLANDISITTFNTSSSSLSVTSDFLFLLTHFMTETRMVQRRPQSKINEFKRDIEQYATFAPSPVSIVIGDNKAESFGAKVENGYYKFLNKDLFPKNVWKALMNRTSTSNSSLETKEVLTSIMNSREVPLKCKVKLIPIKWKYYDDDAAAFYHLFTVENTTVEKTPVNRKIEEVFQNNTETQMENIVQKTALQICLQQENITNFEDVPKTKSERVLLFQKYRQVWAPIPRKILNEAFEIDMPIFDGALTVGYGYLLTKDDISPHTPFAMDLLEPSPVGYQFPNVMKCSKLDTTEIKSYKSYSANMSDYLQERLKYLDFTGKENVSLRSYQPEALQEGFNLQSPEQGDEDNVTLTAVQEYRTVTCQLISDSKQWTLSSEFIEEVDSLTEFDGRDKVSVKQWQNWFNKWGSHVIVHSYGGGSLHGSISKLPNATNGLESRPIIEKTLESVVAFAPFPISNFATPSYKLHGGKSGDENMTENLFLLNKSERTDLVEKWKQSLKHDFLMLNIEFRLQPISALITEKFGQEKGRIVNHTVSLLIGGKLKYSKNYSIPKVEASDQSSVNNSSETNETISSNQVNSTRISCNSSSEALKNMQRQTEAAENVVEHYLEVIQKQNEKEEAEHQLILAQLQERNIPCPEGIEGLQCLLSKSLNYWSTATASSKEKRN